MKIAEAAPVTVLDLALLPGGKDLLPKVPPRARAILVSAAFQFAAEHPAMELTAAGYSFWDFIRPTVWDHNTGETIGRLLCVSQGDPVATLRFLLHAVQEAVSLECALTAQIDALTAELARLRGATPTGPHPVKAA